MKKISLLCLLLGASVCAGAVEPAKLYKKGDFEGALAEYRKMSEQNPYVLYNTANCYYKLGKRGLATLYYLKAFKILPRNSDIRQNLSFVLMQTGQSLVPKDMPQIVHIVYFFFSIYEIKAISYLLFWTLAAMLSLIFLKKSFKKPFLKPLIYLFFLLLIFVAWGISRSASFIENAGVVTENSASLLSGPGDNFKVYSELPEGYLVELTGEEADDFLEAGIPQKQIKGWIKKSEIRKI